MWLILASGALLALLLAACYVLGVGEETLPARPSPAALQEHQKRCGHWFQSPLTMLRATGSLEALRARVNRDKRSKLQQLSLIALQRVEAANGVNATLAKGGKHADGVLRALQDGICLVTTESLALRMHGAWRLLSDARNAQRRGLRLHAAGGGGSNATRAAQAKPARARRSGWVSLGNSGFVQRIATRHSGLNPSAERRRT